MKNVDQLQASLELDPSSKSKSKDKSKKKKKKNKKDDKEDVSYFSEDSGKNLNVDASAQFPRTSVQYTRTNEAASGHQKCLSYDAAIINYEANAGFIAGPTQVRLNECLFLFYFIF